VFYGRAHSAFFNSITRLLMWENASGTVVKLRDIQMQSLLQQHSGFLNGRDKNLS
jgi:hypothetical protein